MTLRRRHMLGLTITDRSITAAELRETGGERPDLVSVTRLDFDAELTWREPAAIGAALAQKLSEAGVRTRQAAAGLPAAWLLTRSVEVPPAEGEMLRKIVATKAEAAFASGGRDLAVDYVAPPPATADEAVAGRAALLVAAHQQRVDAVVTMAGAAGLRLDLVAATAAVLAQVGEPAADPAGRSLTLLVGQGTMELAMQRGRTLESIRHLRTPAATDGEETVDAIAGQLQQFRALSDDADSESELRLWDGVGLAESARDLIAEHAGASQWREGSIDQFAHANGTVTAVAEPAAAGRYAGAVAVARLALEPAWPRVDWLHPRLAEPPKRRLNAPARAGVIVASVLILIALAVGGHYRSAAAEVAALESQLEGMQEEVDTARAVVERVDRADQWFGERTTVLACLQALTVAFGDDGDVWATEVALQENRSGTVAGGAVGGEQVLAVRDRMQASPHFASVALIYMREAERNRGGELGWAIAFEFTASADPESAPEAEPDAEPQP